MSCGGGPATSVLGGAFATTNNDALNTISVMFTALIPGCVLTINLMGKNVSRACSVRTGNVDYYPGQLVYSFAFFQSQTFI